MSGRMLHVAEEPQPAHRCEPPGEQTLLVDSERPGETLIRATDPPGSVWRCECGQLWSVRRDGRYWRRGDRLTRWRHRKAGLS